MSNPTRSDVEQAIHRMDGYLGLVLHRGDDLSADRHQVENDRALIRRWLKDTGVIAPDTCPNQCDLGKKVVATCTCGRIDHPDHYEELDCADCNGRGWVWPDELVDRLAFWVKQMTLGGGLLSWEERVKLVGDLLDEMLCPNETEWRS